MIRYAENCPLEYSPFADPSLLVPVVGVELDKTRAARCEALFARLTRAFRKRKQRLRCTSLTHYAETTKKDQPKADPSLLVPVVGVEPTRYRYHWILSPARLPIPSYRHMTLTIIPHPFEKIKSFLKKYQRFFCQPLENADELCYNVFNKIYLIESNVVTGTMTLQQPAKP